MCYNSRILVTEQIIPKLNAEINTFEEDERQNESKSFLLFFRGARDFFAISGNVSSLAMVKLISNEGRWKKCMKNKGR